MTSRNGKHKVLNGHRPRLSVWKFSSCDGCQLSLLDCEDELLALTDAVEIAYFLEATSATAKGPYDLTLVEGSITTPHDAERIHEIRRVSKTLVTIGACATSGGIQALRNFAKIGDLVEAVYANPDYISTLRTSTAIADHVHVDFELQGCPINKHAAARGRRRVHRRPAAERREPQRLRRVQARRRPLRDGRPRHALPRAGDGSRLRRPLPALRARLLRLLRAVRAAEHGGARRPLARRSAPTTRSSCGRSAASPATRRPSGERRPSMSKSRTAPRTKTIRTDYLARVEGEGGMLVKMRDGVVTETKLRIYEPPRFFEGFLRGRDFREAPDITARICGICPVAYQMAACRAMESARRRRGGGPAARAAAAPLLRRVDRVAHAARLHAPRARLPRRAERGRAGEDQPGARRDGAAAEEDRQRGDARRRRPRGAPDQRPRRRLVQGAEPRAAGRARTRSRVGARRGARDGADRRRARLPGAGAGLPVRGARRRRRVPDRPRRRRRHLARRHLPDRRVPRARRRGARRALERAARDASTASRTSSGRLRATRSTATALAAGARGGGRGGRARAGRSQPVPLDRRAGGRDRARLRGGAAPDRGVRAAGRAGARGRAAGGHRPRRERGAARHPLPPLPARRRAARSSTRRSSRPPRRTSARSRSDLQAFVSAHADLPDDELRRAASRRSATTTRASPARPTS